MLGLYLEWIQTHLLKVWLDELTELCIEFKIIFFVLVKLILLCFKLLLQFLNLQIWYYYFLDKQ